MNGLIGQSSGTAGMVRIPVMDVPGLNRRILSPIQTLIVSRQTEKGPEVEQSTTGPAEMRATWQSPVAQLTVCPPFRSSF